MRTERTAVKGEKYFFIFFSIFNLAIVGEYNNFEEFKAAVEKFIKEIWKMGALLVSARRA